MTVVIRFGRRAQLVLRGAEKKKISNFLKNAAHI
jgi:hypothetical protein